MFEIKEFTATQTLHATLLATIYFASLLGLYLKIVGVHIANAHFSIEGTVWLECYAGKNFLPKLHTPTHISLESLYKAGHDEIVNGAIKHL